MSLKNQIIIRIDTNNAAFESDCLTPELQECFNRVIRDLRRNKVAGIVRDSNGNTCGEYCLTYEKDKR